MECTLHSLIADVALLVDGKVLLVRYKDVNKYDHQQGWFLPDDVIKLHEHPDRAAKRIVKEQLGYSLPNARLSHVESFVGDDGTWHIPFHYFAEVGEAPRLKPSEDLAAAEWFDLTKLPLASQVSHHGWALGVLAKIQKGR